MAVHPIGEPEEVWMERGREVVRVMSPGPPTQEQLEEAEEGVASLSPIQAREKLHNLLFMASARQSGKVTTSRTFGPNFWVVKLDGWPIGKIPGGRGKRARAGDLVRAHYQRRLARMMALDRRLAAGERPEVEEAEKALDKLTPPEARRLITQYLAKLDRRGE